jgi:hypothetical protein
VGVIGGVFVCTGYAIRITTRAVEVVSGADQTPGIVAAETSGAKVGLRAKWGGASLRSRPKSARMVPQGGGWVLEGNNDSPTPYPSTPNGAGGLLTPASAATVAQSPYLTTTLPPSMPPTPAPGSGMAYGLGVPSTPGRPTSGLGPTWTPRTPHGGMGVGVPPSTPGTPGTYATYPRSPSPNGGGFSVGPSPPRRNVLIPSGSDVNVVDGMGLKKDD